MSIRWPMILTLLVVASCVRRAAADLPETEFQFACRDGYSLDGKFQLPEGQTTESAGKVIILLHGSGPVSMDADLTAATRDGKKNLVFKDLSQALCEGGFTVVRYNKRAYQLGQTLKKDPAFARSEFFKVQTGNPLKFIVEDAHDCVKWAATRFPAAAVHFLGVSQGTYVALQVAQREKRVKGVALVGFYATSLGVLVFEQMVYRPLRLFDALDRDHDRQLSAEEMSGEAALARSLRAQMSVIDLDGDRKLSRMEFQAGNFSNVCATDFLATIRAQEASYPRVAEILKEAEFKVAFFQGLLDNQTPAYHAKAIELLAKHVWKKESFLFTYFPGLGHVLDRRESYDDLLYDTMSPDARKTLVRQLKELF